jgi:hypothetical protein
MAVGEALLSGPCEQFVEERPAFVGLHSDDVVSRCAEDE